MKRSTLALLVASVVVTPNIAHALPQLVAIGGRFNPGTIVVRKQERALYYMQGAGQAVRYSVGFGPVAKGWAGMAYITAKYTDPSWIPSSAVRRGNPDLPPFVPGGSPQNPMGVASLTLSGGEYSIHGTSNPSSIGRFGPYGCIGMLNEDVVDLYRRVGIGTMGVVE
jgi:lipoprotein-anchoring transpeptidase ErfK/SrfK